MTLPVFPSLPGLAYPVKRSPNWGVAKADALSGKRTRVSLYTYPTYSYELPFRLLRSASAYQEWQTLVGFINSLNGQTLLFAYDDVNDNTATSQAFGTGDGVTQYFQLVRTLGGFVEPVFLPNGNPAVSVNGTPLNYGIDYNVSATGNVAFEVAPAAGAALTWSGMYYWPCRLDGDAFEITQNFSQIFEVKSLKFSTEKIDTIQTTPPVWYQAYAINGTNPAFFADVTTEATTNHYFYSGSTYSSFAALLAAITGTFSRSSPKYITNSSGDLAQISSGVLPFDYSPTSIGTLNGLLLEGASTNLLYPSNSASTFPSAYGTTVTASGTGPDGASTALFIQNGSGTNYFTPYATVSGLSVPATYTFSVFAKAGSAGGWLMLGTTASSSQGAYFNLNTGTVGDVGSASTASIISFSNGWYRCSITFVVTNSIESFGLCATSSNGEGNYGDATFTSASENCYIFGAQVEALPAASSYIPTTSSTASRAADSLSVPWTATTFTARVKATLTAEINGNSLLDAGNGLLTQAAGPDAQTSNGTQSLTTAVNAYASQNIIVVGGSSSGRILSANGNTAATDAHALVPSAPTEIQVGANTSDASNSNGDYAQIGLWTVAATAAQAAANSGMA